MAWNAEIRKSKHIQFLEINFILAVFPPSLEYFKPGTLGGRRGGGGGSSDVLVGINVAPHLSSPQAQGWDWKKVGRPFRAVAWSCLGLCPHSWFRGGFGFEEEPRLLSESNRAVGEVGWGRGGKLRRRKGLLPTFIKVMLESAVILPSWDSQYQISACFDI